MSKRIKLTEKATDWMKTAKHLDLISILKRNSGQPELLLRALYNIYIPINKLAEYPKMIPLLVQAKNMKFPH